MSELAEKSKLLYESKLKNLLEPAEKGKFVAIEPDTESYFVDKDGTKALLRARDAFPDKLFFLIRIGYKAADSIVSIIVDRKKHLASFLLLLSFVVSIPAQKAQAAADIVEQNLRKHVEYLASDKLEGRRTGEQGATFAAGYISNMFARYKLKAGQRGTNGKANFLQPFPYVAGVTLGQHNFLRIAPANSTKENKMEIGVNWMPLGYSRNGDIPMSQIVFAGYGIVSDAQKYDDYAGSDVKDKIVLVFDGNPDAGNPHSEFGRFNIHTKANIARDKGARAILVIASESDFKNDRLTVLSYDRTLGETAIPVAAIMRAHGAGLLGASDESELAEIEKSIAAKRDARAQFRIANPLNGSAQLKINLAKRQTEAYNVVGILEGNDPLLKEEAIVIGAHYDHLGKGGQGSLSVNSNDIHHGADDNASGTSAIMEIARHFAKEKKNKRTIIFIAFGGEEEGLLGSKYYVNNPVFPLEKTVAMINLDMVGRLKDNRLTVGGIGTASEWRILALETAINQPMRRALTKSSKSNNVVPNLRQSPNITAPTDGITFSTVPPIPASEKGFDLLLNEDGFGPSDHSSFYGKQIPVLFLFTGTHLDYHKPSDTSEKINYQGLERITDYVAEIVKSVDQNVQKPTYTVAKSSGVTGGRMGFNVSLGTIPSYADSTDGLVLDGVRENSPAAKAGIKAGDKIIKLAGKDVRNAMDYTFVLGEMKAGQEYEVILLRGTERLTLKIIPAPAARR